MMLCCSTAEVPCNFLNYLDNLGPFYKSFC